MLGYGLTVDWLLGAIDCSAEAVTLFAEDITQFVPKETLKIFSLDFSLVSFGAMVSLHRAKLSKR